MSDCSIMARSNRFIHRPNIRSQSLPKTHKQLGNREESIYTHQSDGVDSVAAGLNPARTAGVNAVN